jgi:sulfoxide reductase heme-binding subunit YedZ
LTSSSRYRLVSWTAWVGIAIPLAILAWRFQDNGLGANPIEALILWSGMSTLIFLVLTLAVTPVRRVSGWNELVKVRRRLGLSAFAYASLHLMTYVGLHQFFAVGYIIEDVIERPFITVGMGAWLVLLPLALTSTKGWIRRLGRRWQLLHRLAYVAAAMGVIHYYWRVKADTRLPLVFAGVLAVLLLARLWRKARAPVRRSPAG